MNVDRSVGTSRSKQKRITKLRLCCAIIFMFLLATHYNGRLFFDFSAWANYFFNIDNLIGENRTYKFIIVMPTYRRKNNLSIILVERAVRSIMEQSYRNWELYATGDYYPDQLEFEYLFRKIPQEKLFLHNLMKPGERHNLTGNRLWQCAGATANNNALDRAAKAYENSNILKRNEVVIAHLDDDDTWHPNHLKHLAHSYQRFPGTKFVWSRGYYCTTRDSATIYPDIEIIDALNNMPPTYGLTLHSAVSWKMKTFLSFRYRRDWEYNREPPAPADADMWRRMSCFMSARNLSYYLSPLATVEHLQESGNKACEKADKTPVWYPEKK